MPIMSEHYIEVYDIKDDGAYIVMNKPDNKRSVVTKENYYKIKPYIRIISKPPKKDPIDVFKNNLAFAFSEGQKNGLSFEDCINAFSMVLNMK